MTRLQKARKIIHKAIRKAGGKISDYAYKDITLAAAEYLREHPRLKSDKRR